MDDDWETVADDEVVIRPKPVAANVNKWEGEDDDEDVKDSWEDEEEKKDEEKVESKVVPVNKVKSNKNLKTKVTEEERLNEEEEEAKRFENLSPEEKLAEKLRIQKIQKESDLKSALETFGVSNVANGLDAFDPESKEEFKEFAGAICWKLAQYKESIHFPQFLEDLVRNLCVNLSASDIKKVKISVENLYTEKLKVEKEKNKKASAKAKSKATLRSNIDDIDDYQKYGNEYGGDDFDDFM